MLLSYSNTGKLTCDDDCTDSVPITEGACDNMFEFCVREVGHRRGGRCLASKETEMTYH